MLLATPPVAEHDTDEDLTSCRACPNVISQTSERDLCADCEAGGDAIRVPFGTDEPRDTWARFSDKAAASAWIATVAPRYDYLTFEIWNSPSEEHPDRPFAVVSDDV